MLTDTYRIPPTHVYVTTLVGDVIRGRCGFEPSRARIRIAANNTRAPNCQKNTAERPQDRPHAAMRLARNRLCPGKGFVAKLSSVQLTSQLTSPRFVPSCSWPISAAAFSSETSHVLRTIALSKKASADFYTPATAIMAAFQMSRSYCLAVNVQPRWLLSGGAANLEAIQCAADEITREHSRLMPLQRLFY